MSLYSTGDIPGWQVAGVTSQPIAVKHVADFGSCGTVSAHQSILRRVIEDTSSSRDGNKWYWREHVQRTKPTAADDLCCGPSTAGTNWEAVRVGNCSAAERDPILLVGGLWGRRLAGTGAWILGRRVWAPGGPGQALGEGVGSQPAIWIDLKERPAVRRAFLMWSRIQETDWKIGLRVPSGICFRSHPQV